MTIPLPSMEAFIAHADVASTPFYGRRHLPLDDFDENTCAVEIVMKKHQSEAVEEEMEKPESRGKTDTPGQVLDLAKNNPDHTVLSTIMETSRYEHSLHGHFLYVCFFF